MLPCSFEIDLHTSKLLSNLNYRLFFITCMYFQNTAIDMDNFEEYLNWQFRVLNAFWEPAVSSALEIDVSYRIQHVILFLCDTYFRVLILVNWLYFVLFECWKISWIMYDVFGPGPYLHTVTFRLIARAIIWK